MSLAISNDSKIVATGSYDNSIIIWDLSSGDFIRKLQKHSRGIYSVAFSPDSKYLATGSYDKTSIIWDPNSG